MYTQVKDVNDVSGTGRITCPFYEEINNILGTRAASSPPQLLDSGGSHGKSVDREDELGKCIVFRECSMLNMLQQ